GTPAPRHRRRRSDRRLPRGGAVPQRRLPDRRGEGTATGRTPRVRARRSPPRVGSGVAPGRCGERVRRAVRRRDDAVGNVETGALGGYGAAAAGGRTATRGAREAGSGPRPRGGGTGRERTRRLLPRRRLLEPGAFRVGRR